MSASWQSSPIIFNEVISLIDQAMSMEAPTAGMIGVLLQGKFLEVDYDHTAFKELKGSWYQP